MRTASTSQIGAHNPEIIDNHWRDVAAVELMRLAPGSAFILTGTDPIPALGSVLVH